MKKRGLPGANVRLGIVGWGTRARAYISGRVSRYSNSTLASTHCPECPAYRTQET